MMKKRASPYAKHTDRELLELVAARSRIIAELAKRPTHTSVHAHGPERAAHERLAPAALVVIALVYLLLHLH